MGIQALLIVAFVGLFIVFARFEHGVQMRAGKRLAFLAFVALNVYAVLRPDDVTWVANRLGVGRGADLLLYVLVVCTVFLMLNTYLRFRAVERQLTDLARVMALREAERENVERLGVAAVRGPVSDGAAGDPATSS